MKTSKEVTGSRLLFSFSRVAPSRIRESASTAQAYGLPLPLIPSRALHWLKEQALIAGKAACLPDEGRGRLTLWVGFDLLAVPSITLFVWKGEHRHGDIRRAIIAKSRETHPYSVWSRPGNEISVMNTAVTFDQRNPGACVGFKCAELVQIERVPNLTCHCLTVLQLISSLCLSKLFMSTAKCRQIKDDGQRCVPPPSRASHVLFHLKFDRMYSRAFRHDLEDRNRTKKKCAAIEAAHCHALLKLKQPGAPILAAPPGPPATGLRRWGGHPGPPATGLRRWGGQPGPRRQVFVCGVFSCTHPQSKGSPAPHPLPGTRTSHFPGTGCLLH